MTTQLQIDANDVIDALKQQRETQATEAAMFMAACAGYRRRISELETRVAELETQIPKPPEATKEGEGDAAV